MKRIIAAALYQLRCLLTARFGLLLVAAAVYLLLHGEYGELAAVSTLGWGVAAATLLTFIVRLAFGWGRRSGAPGIAGRIHRPAPEVSWAVEVDHFELGLLALTLVHVGVQLAGGTDGWSQPLVYVCVVYLVGFNRRLVGLTLVAGALGIQGVLHWASGASWLGFVMHGGYLLLFAFGSLLFLQIEIARHRRRHEAKLADDIRAMREEARDYRLIRSPLASAGAATRELDEARLTRGAVEAIHQSMFFSLDLLKKSLDLQTCVLLWLDAEGRQLRIKELASDSSLVSETPISAQAGAIGGVVKNRLMLNLSSLRRGTRGLPYYSGPEQVGAFLGVPVLEDSHLRGVLCADRREDRPFSSGEEQVLAEASRHILRSIQNERVFAAVERSKYEHERFYRASTMLNRALTLAEVYDMAFAAAREITEFDFGALTLFDPVRRKHTIVKVLGEADHQRFEGEVFGDNAGLVSMAVKNRHFLPATDTPREREVMLFTRKHRVRGLNSLVVLPLIVGDQAVGTFVLASPQSRRFPKKTREMLGVISNQVAVSIENAKMYKRMEEMATTDGLTGLPNHRTFQSRFSEMLQRAERHGKPVSFILTDVDKFKSVNDTYGHPVGDEVLRRMAKVFAGQVRKVDIVARYGGEEFAIVLEETEADGAHLLSERIRQEVAAQVINSDKGAFRVTVSLGIASYPLDGTDKAQLIERADQALYHAKETGRNRTVRYQELPRSGRRAAG